MGGLVDEALRLGARLSTNGNNPQATSLLRVEGIFAKWLLFKEWKSLRAVLAAVAAHIAGGEGIWVFIIDAPGSGKTEIIRALYGLHGVYPLSSLTPQTFASGKAVTDSRKDPSLLLRLPNECILTLKDFTTVLSMHHESRQEILAQLRELADGSFVKEFGTGKSVSWEGRMCFIAGVTPALDTHWAVGQTLGERFIQVRPTAFEAVEVGDRSQDNVGLQDQMRQELQAAVTEFMGGLDYPAVADIAMPPQLKHRLSGLAAFVVRARSAVFRDGYRKEIDYIPVPEGPARLAKQLATLIRGRAIIDGRDAVNDDDFEEIIEIGFDCIPPHRRQVIEALLEEGELTTTTVSTRTRYPTDTARRILQDLTAIGMICRSSARDEKTGADTWRLSEEALSWHSLIGTAQKSSREDTENIYGSTRLLGGGVEP